MIRYRRRFPPGPLPRPPTAPPLTPPLDLFDTITARTQNKGYPQKPRQAKRQSFDAQKER